MVDRLAPRSLVLAALTLLLVGPLAAAAVTQSETGGTGSGTSSTSNTNRSFTTNTNGSNANVSNTNASNTNAASNVNRGLDAARLRVCENREAAINRILDRMLRRAQRHLEVFTAIAERVEAYATRRGRPVADYDALVAAVNAKQAAARTQIEALTLRAEFSCADDNPQGMVSAFREQHTDTLAALKALRDAVRDLTVAVKSAGAVTNGNANSTANANAQ